MWPSYKNARTAEFIQTNRKTAVKIIRYKLLKTPKPQINNQVRQAKVSWAISADS